MKKETSFLREEIDPGYMGIYIIRNLVNRYKYIGQSIDLSVRRYQHYFQLKNGRHVNKALQSDFSKGDEFVFEIIEYVSYSSLLTTKEQEWINQVNPEYNIAIPYKHYLGFPDTSPNKLDLLEGRLCPSCKQYVGIIISSLKICNRCYRERISRS